MLPACPQCGSALVAGAVSCEVCHRPTGATAMSVFGTGDELTVLSSLSSATIPAAPGTAQLFAGQLFGPYRIERLLGQGGMGEVYEAEHLEHARRVALKVLHDRLADPADRSRFLREGQLAASVTHPHTVYIFGSEEIAGTPVIAMELLPGGTLKDRVQEQGPLPPAAAVDATLQIIAGLDAAHASGILHRDIKPSNCFVDSDGTVKVGDFGLSISTLAREATVVHLTTVGTIQGTPQFASPEQLRGEPLDVRSDVYAVGASLYFLLTGQAPFDDRDLMALVTRIATQAPRSPRELRPEVPKALAAIVLRCLAKKPADRPTTYAELAAALDNFSSAALVPAPPGRRLAAAVIDTYLLALVSAPATMWLGGFDVMMVPNARTIGVSYIVGGIMTLVYFATLEGVWGRSLGKLICGLRVVRADRDAPGLPAAAVRTLLFMSPLVLQLPFDFTLTPRLLVLQQTGGAMAFLGVVPVLWFIASKALLFIGARRDNGYAGFHERATGTRTILKPAAESRRAAAQARDEDARASGPMVGAYRLLAADRPAAGDIAPAVDERLGRRVWLQISTPETAPVPAWRRLVRRPTRLRWLAGRRTPQESWDAFEAPGGQPLLQAAASAPPWDTVRFWLSDLVQEVRDGLADRSLPDLSLDRVWIDASGRARLLDWPAPGLGPPGADGEPPTVECAPIDESAARRFLDRTAAAALGGQGSDAHPVIPLHAREFLSTLEPSAAGPFDRVVEAAAALRATPVRVTRARRALHLLTAASLPAFVAIGIVAIIALLPHILARAPEGTELAAVLSRIDALNRKEETDATARERRLFEVYVSAVHRSTLENARTQPTSLSAQLIRRRLPLAERALAAHPNPTAEDVRDATDIVKAHIARTGGPGRGISLRGAAPLVLSVVPMFFLFPAVLGTIGASFKRGGPLLRMFGMVVVDNRGRPASRGRALNRAVVAWTPIWLVNALSFAGWSMLSDRSFEGALVRAAFLAVLVAGGAYAIASPSRGLQDRIAGTWLVPR